jgi:hypothetical protein
MPAVNTPQFSWVLSRLPRHPQPVPPIYQPEVAAQGVVFAADHADRKEHWVGASTVGTIMAQKFAAPVLDRYLARTGFDSQQTQEPAVPGRPNNLWQPVDQPPGSDEGAHGVFDSRAHGRSAQLTVTERVEEAGATVRRALGSLFDAARSRSPQPPWSAATSQQTDPGAIPASDAGPPPGDHDANLADHDTDLADLDASLADPDTAVVNHDTSVPTIDPSLPEPNVKSAVDEQTPSANRHSFLDDIDTPLASQDARAVDQDAPVTDEDSDWTDQGVVPPTQIDVPPGEGAAAPAEDGAPLRLEDL